ncbi:Lipid_binding protein [Hexamita inflata]|uniref:Lipid binding protein n=1 Tax=Hexamita inflata TaxID=28002 RepID=A0AA86QHI3_9EUKA|nr:Lipid binding protein [Hexamita inflata]
MQKLKLVPQSVWDKLLPIQQQCVDEVMNLYKSITFGSSKKFKDVVDMSYGAVSKSSFKAIRGTVEVKGDILKAIAFDLQDRETTPDQPKAERHGRVCKYMYYPDSATADYCVSLKQSPAFKPICLLMHQINESGVPLVSDREFVTLRISQQTQTGYIVITRSVTIDELNFATNVVRGNNWNFNLYEKTEGGFKATTFFYCDPCGNVPAMAFNSTLEGQMGFLKRVKQVSE